MRKAYKLDKYLTTPYQDPGTRERYNFNKRLSSANSKNSNAKK